MSPLQSPRRHVVADFEFRPAHGIEGNPVEVVCGCFKQSETGESATLWFDELGGLTKPPFFDEPNTVLVAYFATAELGCFRALGWSTDIEVVDLYAEFRTLTNGLELPEGRSLIGAANYFGVPAQNHAHKAAMQQLALRGGPFSDIEKSSLMAYCAQDVDMTNALFLAMKDQIDYPRAMLRGRFCSVIAEMEGHGSPVDFPLLDRLRSSWTAIKECLTQEWDYDFGVYADGRFSEARFEAYLAREQIAWPRHASGRLKLRDDTFKDMARVYPQIKPLRYLRECLSKLRLTELKVGIDGRNRCLLSPFGATTSRNTPSPSEFIFGWPKWARGLIQPKPGRSIAYLDYCQQEFGIAAALSGDQNMLDAYRSGDPYLAFAIQAGAVPRHATKNTHHLQRAQFKACVLAVQYGMGADSLALRIGEPVVRARQLLNHHRNVYRRFWQWSDDVFNTAVADNELRTIYGWRITFKPDLNPRSVRNFPMQATAAEMLRAACILIHAKGIQLCAPIHDAILIEADDHSIVEHAASTQRCMAQASGIVLNGFELSSDSRILTFPDRFLDKESEPFWEQVIDLLGKAEAQSVKFLTPTC